MFWLLFFGFPLPGTWPPNPSILSKSKLWSLFLLPNETDTLYFPVQGMEKSRMNVGLNSCMSVHLRIIPLNCLLSNAFWQLFYIVFSLYSSCVMIWVWYQLLYHGLTRISFIINYKYGYFWWKLLYTKNINVFFHF